MSSKQTPSSSSSSNSNTKKRSKGTDALAVVGKKTEIDDSTLAAENFFGSKDSSVRENLPAMNVFPVGPSRINCMIMLDVREKPARLNIVNPGADFEEIIAELKSMAADIGATTIKLDYIFITHAHINTFAVANQLLKLGDGSGHIVLHERDAFLWDRWETQATELGLDDLVEGNDDHTIGKPTKLLTEPVTTLKSGETTIRCLHTPGVSPGSTCFFFEELEVCYTGCVLLANAIGRTTWIGIKSLHLTANARVLRRSIDEILIDQLDPDVQIVPSFGPLSSLRNEVHMNGHLKILSSRWNAYNDVQEEIKRRLRAQEKLAEDPYGDGLPF